MAPAKTREELAADWWKRWRAENYSWEGLLDPNKDIARDDGLHSEISLQDYWRIDPETGDLRSDAEMQAAGELETAPNGSLWHIAHVPLEWPFHIAGKLSWGKEKRDFLAKIFAARIAMAKESTFSFTVDEKTVEVFDRRAQLQGSILLDPPAHPSGLDAPVHIVATRCWLPGWGAERYKFGPGCKFNCAAFSGDARFDDALFSGDTCFDQAIFLRLASFFGARFSGSANFDESNFLGEARYNYATFSGDANFVSVDFSDVKFDRAKFSGISSFLATNFSGRTSFTCATFSGGGFDNATFSYYANFDGVTFSGNLSFDGASFSDGASFDDSVFLGFASFNSASFSGDTSFSRAALSGDASFYSASFSSDASFYKTTFAGEARFNSVKFQGSSFFQETKFEVADGKKHLSGPMSFSKAVFAGPVDFDRAVFAISPAHHSAAFLGARFTDLVSFRDCGDHWVAALDEAEIKGRILIDERNEADALRDFDTIVLPRARDAGDNPATGESLLKELEGGCRTIKVAMGSARNEIMEQRYYRFQLRARREQAGVLPSERLVSHLFGWAADYGLSLTRPLAGLALLLMVFAFVHALFWHATGSFDGTGAIKSIEMAASRMFPFGAFEFVSRDWFNELASRGAYPYTLLFARLLASLQSLIALLLIFLFGLAVRRRFKVGE